MQIKSKRVAPIFRKAFVWTCVLGIISNLTFDIFSMRQLKSAEHTGDLVTDTYEVMIHLQKLDRAIEVLLIPPITKPQYERLYAEINELKKIVKNPRQQELLLKITEEVQSPKNIASATGTAAEMLQIESRILEERIQNDSFNNQETERSLIRGLVLDALLLILLFMFFLFDARSRKKVEQNLLVSLNNLRSSHLVLQEEQQKRQMSLKTTVHDLKNPLGTIRGFAELLADEVGSSSSAQEFSETIKRISQNSLELVDSLLNPEGHMHLKMSQTDLLVILDEICAQVDVLAKTKKQTITKQFLIDEAPIAGNPMKLDELFANLISNAIKYSPLASNIWIRCFRIKDKYRVEIEDQGPGFTEEDKLKAFQYGQKLSAKPTGNESSTGYGLFIAKQIVELHHGKIKIEEAKSGQGACIAFEIPIFSEKKNLNV